MMIAAASFDMGREIAVSAAEVTFAGHIPGNN
jgi:hypothetical protein